MVVIESGSMQHSDVESSVGVIDTGDLTIVKSMDRTDRIVTWVEGRKTGYSSYGDYGDVIVFHKNGVKETTPVIHRALVYIELNETTQSSFDVPSLDLHNVRSLTLENLTTYHTGSRTTIDLTVDLGLVLRNYDGVKEPHGGYLTKGDHNPTVDQLSLYMNGEYNNSSPKAEPIIEKWVVGVSRGELPWFGALKLMFSEDAQDVPTNSIHNLLITIALLVIVPTMIDLAFAVVVPWVRERRGIGVTSEMQEDTGLDGDDASAEPVVDWQEV
jgi:signal peptidase